MPATPSKWDYPLDPLAITTEAVASKRRPILRVLHEEGYGGWQFYDDVEPLQEPVVIPKDQLLALDPSLLQVKDLPVEWEAIRSTRSAPWQRREVEQ